MLARAGKLCGMDTDMNVQECPATPAADSLAQNFRALVQQYYTHIEKKNYTAND